MNTKITTTTLLAGLLVCTMPRAFAQTPASGAAATTTTTTATTTTTTAAANVGQTVTLNSTAYVVNAKTQLATGVEYYSLKATPKSAVVNYLRTNNSYNATSFSKAQYSAFLKTGKISSFGTIKEMTTNGKKVQYAVTGSSMAVVAAKSGGGGVNIYEFKGPSVTALAADDGTGTGGCNSDLLGKDLCCAIDCICTAATCPDYNKCVSTCRGTAAIRTTIAMHAISTAKPILFQ